MSRIGKLPIAIPSGVTVSVSDKNYVVVKGPKGQLDLQVDPDIQLAQENGELLVSRPTDQKRHRALHGLYRSLLANLITGVSDGFKRELEVIGVGYRAEVNNGVLELALGYSHPIYFLPPDGVTITAASARGQNPRVTVEGIDKQLVGQVAAKIRGLRPPEPYKGKGIRYTDEFVRRKAGKTAAR
ncbi:MAG: 50S ribosomal protein L6 [Rubricoccaceae bacterium]